MRKMKILSIIVEQYIRTGEPVGSKAIAQLIDLHVSPATVRNDMAALFEMGLLEQPHTSAGRIPSHLGYRVYIDRLMNCQPLSQQEKDEIDALFNVHNPDPDQLLEDAAEALADYTGCATISTTMTPKNVSVKKVELIPAAARTVVVMVIASNGVIKNKVIRVDFNVTPKLCDFFTSFANGRLAGRSLNEISTWYINSLVLALGEYSQLFTPLLAGIYELCREINDGQYYMGGEVNLLHYQELEQMARDLLLFLSHRDKVLPLVSGGRDDLSVVIGKENQNEELAGSSVVVARYNIGTENCGAIAVIGPVRLNYQKLLPHIEYFAKTLGELLSETLEQE